MSLVPSLRRTPRIVATGFTTAFLGDERTLREFIVGDYVTKSILASGENAALYLIVDSYDPLSERQLRIGVDKKERLIKQFEQFCGRPIAEIPDPFGCHPSYSDHFAEALLNRLRSLDIHPVVLDSYRAYDKGHYAPFIAKTFENYSQIRELMENDFAHVAASALFRARCEKCLCVDATDIRKVENEAAQFTCKRCGIDWWQGTAEVRGKLSWKLDCAARWNLYGIDMETFATAHVEKLGTVPVSRAVSERWFGGRIPAAIKYGSVKISRDISNQLLAMLPPDLLKRLFYSNITRDLTLNREVVESFCHNTPVRPGLTYTNYVRRQLPLDALRDESQSEPCGRTSSTTSDKTLVACANRFAKFYYGREYQKHPPHLQALVSCDHATAETALRFIRYTLEVRNGDAFDEEKARTLMRTFVREQEACPQVYRLLRSVFGCEEGPHITTLLLIISKDHLRTAELILVARGLGGAPTHRVAAANASEKPLPDPLEEETVTNVGVKS